MLSGKTTAVKEGDEYVINGSKMFITNGTLADFLLVFAVPTGTGTATRDTASSLSKRTGRASRRPKSRGRWASGLPTRQNFLQQCPNTAENLVGDVENEGFKQVMYLFNINRLIAAHQALGAARGLSKRP